MYSKSAKKAAVQKRQESSSALLVFFTCSDFAMKNVQHAWRCAAADGLKPPRAHWIGPA